MPLPKRVENGYRGVEIRPTHHGYVVVIMSHNRWRFNDASEAKAFIDYQHSRLAFGFS